MSSQTSLEHNLAQSWLAALGEASSSGNVDGFVSCIAPDGWLRDLLIFSPTLSSRRGHAAIAEHIKPSLASPKFSNFSLDPDAAGQPTKSMFGPTVPVVMLAFDFETANAWGKGHARLLYPKEGEEANGAKALTVMLSVRDWKGHEEMANESGIFDSHNLSYAEVREERFKAIAKDPQAIISTFLQLAPLAFLIAVAVGAGQSGLQTAARFKQMGIRTIVVEQSARVGDVWRDRYPTLALHTPKEHHCCMYHASAYDL